MDNKPKGRKGATPYEIEQMCQMRKNGFKIKEIAIKFGTDYDWTQDMLKKHQVLKDTEKQIISHTNPVDRAKFVAEWAFWTDLLSGRRKLVRYGN